VNAAALTDLEGTHHVRVVNLREQSRFALKPAQDVRIFRLGSWQNFQRNELARFVAGLVHATHLPLTNLIENLVIADEKVIHTPALHELRLVFGECSAGNEEPAE